MRGFLSVRAVPGVEEVDGDTYRRTIAVDGAPGVLEVSPGGEGHLLLRAHLPYWEGLIHVVGQVTRLLGVEADHGAGVAALSADPVLGPLVRVRPGLVVPGAWSALEVGVRAVLGRGRTPGETAERLGSFVTTLGTRVPGLPGGLTHTFPEAAKIAVEEPVIGALAADVAGEHEALGHGTGPDTMAALPYADLALRHDLAFRLGYSDAFPSADPSLRAALDDLGLDPAASPERWRPWRSLAAAHLMAHADALQPGALPASHPR